eukprot:1148609-Pelagomonas_calceolata.AAC.7
MPSKIGYTPPKRNWPLPWTITLITYTTGALTPVTLFFAPNTISSQPDSQEFPSATPSMTIGNGISPAAPYLPSAILYTEAMATFMFLPASDKDRIG